jgi:hypothetical protein
MDFVDHETDYGKMVEVIGGEYAPGITRINFSE